MVLPEIDKGVLTAVVRQALDKPEVDVANWTCLPLPGGFAADNTIFRVTGNAIDGTATIPWSVVLKVVVRPDTRTSLDGEAHDRFHDWAREPLAYRSTILTEMPEGLKAPRCFAVQQPTSTSYWLWLEYVPDVLGGSWPLDRYALAARHLGAFNGGFLSRPCLPQSPWLNRQYLRKYVALGCEVPVMAQIQDAATWRVPHVRRLFDPTVAERLVALWTDTEVFVSTAERLPQTLCHLDAHRRNLLARVGPTGRQATVAIDWAAIGIDAVGADAAQFALSTLVFDGVPRGTCQHFAELVFEAYLEGLQRAGWQGDPRMVRFGFAAFAVVRWGINVAGLVLDNAATEDPAVHAETEQWLGRPVNELLERWTALTYLLLEQAEAARGLIRSMH